MTTPIITADLVRRYIEAIQWAPKPSDTNMQNAIASGNVRDAIAFLVNRLGVERTDLVARLALCAAADMAFAQARALFMGHRSRAGDRIQWFGKDILRSINIDPARWPPPGGSLPE